jgi:hypothetical protein
MHSDIFNRWTAALKYGRHVIPAEVGSLKTVMRCPGCYRYSALGVLCHVAATDGVIIETGQGFLGPAPNRDYAGLAVWNHHEQIPLDFFRWTGDYGIAGGVAPALFKLLDKMAVDRKLTLPDFGRLLEQEGIYELVASHKQT